LFPHSPLAAPHGGCEVQETHLGKLGSVLVVRKEHARLEGVLVVAVAVASDGCVEMGPLACLDVNVVAWGEWEERGCVSKQRNATEGKRAHATPSSSKNPHVHERIPEG